MGKQKTNRAPRMDLTSQTGIGRELARIYRRSQMEPPLVEPADLTKYANALQVLSGILKAHDMQELGERMQELEDQLDRAGR